MSDSSKAPPPSSPNLNGMKLKKLTTLLVVDDIEACLGTWQKLGYEVTVRVPETGPAGFVILAGAAGELMLQTKASLSDDMTSVAERKPSHLLYGDVESLKAAEKALVNARVIVPRRKTFYGATEIWWELEDGVVLGLAEH
jgi:hypothetical protein